MPEVHRCHQISPLFRIRQFVSLGVAGVPHDAVTSEGLSLIHALGVVDRIVGDFGGDVRVAAIDFLQEFLRRQHFEGVGCGSPKYFGSVARRLFAHVGHARCGVFIQDFDFVGRVFGLISFFVRLS